MGIFSSIKDAIFGGDAKAEEKPVETKAAAPAAAPKASPIREVDVEARLDAKPGSDKLNWRTSIVDLFKLIGLDPSYANRKELAQELGNSDYSGTAEDNIWLHKATMREVAKNGGKVPSTLTD